MHELLLLLAGTVVIFLAASMFTKGIEALGTGLGLGDGAVGSLFAAWGTAMPETMVPLMALLWGRRQPTSQDVGIGAILGAPFLLGTLAFFLIGAVLVVLAKRKRRPAVLAVDSAIVRRDMGFFLLSYGVAVLAGFLPGHSIKPWLGIGLIAGYLLYSWETIRDARGGPEGEHRGGGGRLVPLLQAGAGFAGLLLGASLFVTGVEGLGRGAGVSAFVLSVILTPVATELPEVLNSLLWLARRRDVLALGNVTGAMVFQGSVVPAIGMWLTPWNFTGTEQVTAALALLGAGQVYWASGQKAPLSGRMLLWGGVFYAVFLVIVFAK